ncbi:FliH/SctL family protein [Gynuella sunshinyii]|uniref:Flagellar assembly protein FliH n=1 Tax=Gynuella sunshinyii YC6258 TaxID=1445510 RepID=A0A0C5VAI7_9GAMM|nr:FliH/SctL family protein [Gynuella sunshinyii]AJQ96335.1 flagellar biosynthesis/type III secretory pathway protein [Gynuella sunshinyii YC6258]
MKQRQTHNVETWALPKWDKNGKPVEKAAQPLTSEAVENTELEPEEELRLPTARELQDIRDQAWQEGWQEGLKKGHEEGLQKGLQEGREQGLPEGVEQGIERGRKLGHEQGLKDAQAEMDQLRMTFAILLTQLDEQLQSERTELDQALVSLVMRLTKNLVLRELSMSPELIQAIVAKAVSALPNPSERIVIEVNPQHVELVNELAEQHESDWVVKSNEQLAEGGCTLRTTNSLVDYTLEHRFKQQIEAILTEADLNPDVLMKILQDPAELLTDEVQELVMEQTLVEPVEADAEPDHRAQQVLSPGYGTPTPGQESTLDQGTPTLGQEASPSDQETPTPGQESTPDHGTPTPALEASASDQGTPTPGQESTPDQGTPTSEQEASTPDQGTPTPGQESTSDQGTPTPGQESTSDQGTPTPGQESTPDQGTPTLGQEASAPDQGTPTSQEVHERMGMPASGGMPGVDEDEQAADDVREAADHET